MRDALKRLLQKLYKLAVPPEKIPENPYISAKKLHPLEGDRGFYVIPNHCPAGLPRTGDAFPVPPHQFWEGYGTTPEEDLGLGREHVASLVKILREPGSAGHLRRVLLRPARRKDAAVLPSLARQTELGGST